MPNTVTHWVRYTALVLIGGGLLSLMWPLPGPPDTVPQTLQITDRTGTPLRTLTPQGHHTPVRLSDIDTTAVQALIATEDKRFYQHWGVDLRSVAAAAHANWTAGRIVRGGSTLTMQVARTLRNRSNRGWLDKLAETHLALRLELRWSKERILETWLNRVSFGNRAHGIEAAARMYFGTSARDLTPHQSTYLIGLPQSPSRHNPYRHPDRAKARQQQVLSALVQNNVLAPADSAEWADVSLSLWRRNRVMRAPHFTEALRTNPQADPTAREWRTTLDADLQTRVEARVRSRLRALRGQHVTNAAVIVLDNATGAIRAYVGSKDFWDTHHGGQNDGVRMQRQPGSTLKPFVYGHALQTGQYTPASILPDIPLHIPEAGGAFSPQNYDNRFCGPVSVREALAASYNVPAVHVTRKVGPSTLLSVLHNAGFESLTRSASHYGVGLALGNGEVPLLRLAEAYAGLARGGSRIEAQSLAWVRTASGDTVAVPTDPPSGMGLQPATTAQLTDILSDDDARTPTFGASSPLELPFPVAVKTGTSKDYRDNWTVGYTPEHTVAVWVGNFDGSPMQHVSGVTGAGPIFHDVMHELGPGGSFDTETGLVGAAVCPESGHKPGAHCPLTRTEHFQPGTVPTDTCTVHQRIAIDRRTNERATPQTPETHVAERVYTVHPAKYHDWMRREGHRLPPARPESASVDIQTAQHAEAPQRPTITYPTPGSRYVIDPVLRAEHQRLHFRGHAPDNWTDMQWFVNETPTRSPWALTPGQHTITLSARAPDGTRRVSPPVSVTVYEVEDTP